MAFPAILEASVPTGLEPEAMNELNEKLGTDASKEQGRIRFEVTDLDMLQTSLKLRCVDNLFLRMSTAKLEIMNKESDECIKIVKEQMPTREAWNSGLLLWQHVYGPLPGGMEKSLANLDLFLSGASIQAPEEGADWPSFRVTCLRAGDKHSFSSQDAAKEFGGWLEEHFKWKVKMKDFDLNVVLRVRDNEVSVSLALNTESLFKRNVVAFGPTTLRSTIAQGLVRLARPQPGETLLDPMCGSGQIPLEAALSFPQLTVLAGDNHPVAMEYSLKNFEHNSSELLSPLSLLQWDTRRLPLRSASVDCVVTDLPFGKRLGSKSVNRKLYPEVLSELARVCNGRAVLLTQDKVSMGKAVQRVRQWKVATIVAINVGGLAAAAYVLRKNT